MKKALLILSTVFCSAMMNAQSMSEAVYSPKATDFSVFAPSDAKKVIVNIYNNGDDATPAQTLPLQYNPTSERWAVNVPGDQKGKFYTFQVDAGEGLMAETPGVFAKAVGVNGKRAAVIDMKETDPKDWNKDHRPIIMSPADLVIYEMHHRDFSIDPSAEIKNGGKYLAMTESKALRHLASLGINAVHILPSFDYASIDESRLNDPQYNWGYDPKNYNVPDGSYSTDPADPKVRIREFKEMVQNLHRADIRVILDVVYNHTFNVDDSGFHLTYPGYYYRYNKDGKVSDGSGCGNETASEKPMMRKFMIESVLYWINEYHIDGFRFDLMGIHDIETMNQIRAAVDEIDPSIFIYGEGWSAGSCAYPNEKLAMKANTRQLNRIAAFCDDMRDALRGPFSDDKQGAFLAGLPGHEESIKFGIAGCIEHPQIDMKKVNYSDKAWANDPTQKISYVSCHDDMCLVDRLKASIPGIKEDELVRLDLLAQTAVFTSQGVPFILSGEEMMRDKKGVHNSFNSPDEINHLDWNNREKYPQVLAYYTKLIFLRRTHPAFRLSSGELVRKHLEFLPTADNIVAFCLKNHAGGDSWNNIYVILNSNRDDITIDLPEASYTIVCKDCEINEKGLESFNGSSVKVAAQTAVILHD